MPLRRGGYPVLDIFRGGAVAVKSCDAKAWLEGKLEWPKRLHPEHYNLVESLLRFIGRSIPSLRSLGSISISLLIF